MPDYTTLGSYDPAKPKDQQDYIPTGPNDLYQQYLKMKQGSQEPKTPEQNQLASQLQNATNTAANVMGGNTVGPLNLTATPPPVLAGGASGGGGGMPAGAGGFMSAKTASPSNWNDFFTKFLQGEGIPVTPQALDFMQRWNRAEGNGAAWNPWNTTQNAPGAWNFNGVGVKNFPNEQTALNAYIGLFNRNPNWYGSILQALRGGNEMAMAQAVYNSPWGTHNIFNVMR